MLRWGNGSVPETWTGAKGAPMTPSSNLRSEVLPEDEVEEEDTEGARASWPLIHCPHRPSFLPPSPHPSGSGPSISGASASVDTTGRALPDLPIAYGSASGGCCCCDDFLRRSRAEIGDALLAGDSGLDLDLDLAGDRPRTTSSLSAVKKLCFFSITTPKKNQKIRPKFQTSMKTQESIFKCRGLEKKPNRNSRKSPWKLKSSTTEETVE